MLNQMAIVFNTELKKETESVMNT